MPRPKRTKRIRCKSCRTLFVGDFSTDVRMHLCGHLLRETDCRASYVEAHYPGSPLMIQTGRGLIITDSVHRTYVRAKYWEIRGCRHDGTELALGHAGAPRRAEQIAAHWRGEQ